MYKQTLCLSDLLANKNVNINLKNNFKKIVYLFIILI